MSKFSKELIKDYADKLLIGLSDEETEIISKEFDINNCILINMIKNWFEINLNYGTN